MRNDLGCIIREVRNLISKSEIQPFILVDVVLLSANWKSNRGELRMISRIFYMIDY